MIKTIAFQGIDTLPIDVEVKILSGLPSFTIVGLPDKTVAESRDRLRATFSSLGLALPAKKILVNLAPASLTKEGSHFDLAIAVAILCAMQVLDQVEMENYIILGELGLNGDIRPVKGVLPAAMNAFLNEKSLICPMRQASEARMAGDIEILGPSSLMQLVQHFKGEQTLSSPDLPRYINPLFTDDMSEVKGQYVAKRAMEIAAAGGHNLLMSGPPGAGKSMLAKRLVTILPHMTSEEMIETSTIHSVAGMLEDGKIQTLRPYRFPHYSASLPSLVGGGANAKPGEISLAHNGVLFLDELPEFSRQCLEALRQPIEDGQVMVSRAKSHVTYPAKFQLIAAMNPCRCGYLTDPEKACSKAPDCGQAYQSKLSGPLLDRFDLFIQVEAVKPQILSQTDQQVEDSEVIRNRVENARKRQQERFQLQKLPTHVRSNSQLSAKQLDEFLNLSSEAKTMIEKGIDFYKLTARGYYRLLRLVQTIADLNQRDPHTDDVMEAFSYRL